MNEEKVKKEMQLLADKIANGLEDLRRPFIIEFSGTPKAGKTFCVDVISKFMSRSKIPVYVVSERASVCPITDKKHIYFNTWTGLQSLSQMITSRERKVSVVIFDRGIFDTLVWIDFHRRREAINTEDHSVFEKFLLMDLWVGLIDLVVVLDVNPIEALRREYQNQLTDHTGSVMNEETLSQYNECLVTARDKYKNNFRRLLNIDTTKTNPLDGAREIAQEVLRIGDQLIDEEIAVIPRTFVDSFMPITGFLEESSRISDFMDQFPSKIQWKRRTVAENDHASVQLIPAAVIKRQGDILVFNIRGEKQGSLTNRRAIWVGGHVRSNDQGEINGHTSKTVLQSCLRRELYEELKIRTNLENISKLPRAIIWDRGSSKSLKHLCIMFEYQLPKEHPKETFDLHEIYETPQKSLFTQYHPLNNNLIKLTNWESWSVIYLSKCHGIGFGKERFRQSSLL